MATQESPLRQEIVRPAKPRKPTKATPRRTVAGPLKALVGPQTLSQALDRAIAPQRRRELAPQSGYAAQAQKLTFEPYWRALVVRQLRGGTRHELPHGLAADPLYEGQGARREIWGPGLAKANAQRPTQPFGEVLAAVRAAVEARPQAVRLGREPPLGAAPPRQLREMGQLLERTQIWAAPPREVPPPSARWARTSQPQARAGIKVPVRLRAGYGGMDRGMVTGAQGNDTPYCGARRDLETAAPGQVYLLATG